MELNYTLSLWQKHGPYTKHPLRLGSSTPEEGLYLFQKYSADSNTEFLILGIELKHFRAQMTPEEKEQGYWSGSAPNTPGCPCQGCRQT